MSSRAMRKLQNQNEQQNDPSDPSCDFESGSELDSPVQYRKTVNAFDLLGEVEDGQDQTRDEDSGAQEDGGDNRDSKAIATTSHAVTNRIKKKKKRKHKKVEDPALRSATPVGSIVTHKGNDLDEIDLALKALPADQAKSSSNPLAVPAESFYGESLLRMLAVEHRHLNAMNEMKRLFGSVALQTTNENAISRRPQRGGVIHLDLGSALTAQYSPVSRGQGLTGVALRRNVFMNGKEEWPRSTSGGLEMSVGSVRNIDGKTEYCFHHNKIYKDIERQFMSCVASMDPQRLITLLTYNPYHVSTLLQVSEIAKQQGDHSVSGDLLERALFTFGRSVHSSFPSNLAKGLANLNFSFFENREFWLTAWRYIDNLGQRGTWRTAYEWAKLVLSLDLKDDPYGILLILDSIAIRGGQAEHFLSLVHEISKAYLPSTRPKADASLGNTNDDFACVDLAILIMRPNLAISAVLARHKTGHEQAGCLKLLDICIKTWPFIFARLFQELDIDPLPKSVWGRAPKSDRDRLSTESYAQRAKDLWNTPGALALLKQAAQSVLVEEVHESGHSETPVTLDETRHLLLSNKPPLMALMPREFSRLTTSASDPIPPTDGSSYWDESEDDVSRPSRTLPMDLENIELAPIVDTPRTDYATRESNDEQRELEGLQSWFSRFWRRDSGPDAEEDDEELNRVAEESGVPQEVILTRQNRLVQLAQRLLGIDVSSGPSRPQTPDVTAARDDAIAVPGTFPEDGVNHHSIHDDIETNGDEALLRLARPEEHAVAVDARSDRNAEPTHRSSRETSDVEKTKRYLAGAGMLALKDFITQHGGDMEHWRREGDQVFADGTALVENYAAKSRTLTERDRRFMIDYPLAQGAGQAARDLVLASLCT